MSTGNKTELGGIREVSVSISSYGGGNYDNDNDFSGVYGKMRYESGVHRVQRVPVNDSKCGKMFAWILKFDQSNKSSLNYFNRRSSHTYVCS